VPRSGRGEARAATPPGPYRRAALLCGGCVGVAVVAVEVALAQRNARLRAWREHGAPVAGGWRRDRAGRGRLSLSLRCGACRLEVDLDLWESVYTHQPAALLRVEARALAHLEGVYRCRHLSALLREDPPEVVALTKLELLAGDGAP
jgi:hypothetical protein